MMFSNRQLPVTPAAHFKLLYYSVVLRMITYVAELIGKDGLAEQFPFLLGYGHELQQHGLPADHPTPLRWWQEQRQNWEQQADSPLPLLALAKAASLSDDQLELLIAIGLVEEDQRFGLLYEAIAGQKRPTIALLSSCWSNTHDPSLVRNWILQFYHTGLLYVANPDAPRSEWLLQIPPLLWDAICGSQIFLPTGLTLVHQLPDPTTLVYHPDIQSQLARLPDLLKQQQLDAVVVRGPEHNGRQTLLEALAAQLGYYALIIEGPAQAHDPLWRLIGALATLLHAMPIIRCHTHPGETYTIPALAAYQGPIGIVAGSQGGLVGPCVNRSMNISIDLPHPAQRSQIWQRALQASESEIRPLATQFRITSGHIWQAAQLTQLIANCEGQAATSIPVVRQATQSLSRQAFETLATHLPAAGDWSQFAAADDTLHELQLLERRCRYREELSSIAVGGAILPNTGVRALLSGPSGTGKTLAARLLANALQLDCYRIDLAGVVNKYIGETEKNLNTIFARAEALNVLLLLDEGDALLTRRTNVNSSNDRYANLETNYLLQRLEGFSGILVITTNAAQRIDDAFQRRMDVVIEFRQPEAQERSQIWKTHLPVGHAIAYDALEEISYHCAMSGGQIRNAALYATLLALESQVPLQIEQVISAIEREYRKIGAVCPIPMRSQIIRYRQYVR